MVGEDASSVLSEREYQLVLEYPCCGLSTVSYLFILQLLLSNELHLAILSLYHVCDCLVVVVPEGVSVLGGNHSPQDHVARTTGTVVPLHIEHVDSLMQVIESLVAELGLDRGACNVEYFCHLVETFVQVVRLFVLLDIPFQEINLQVLVPDLVNSFLLLLLLLLPNVPDILL